MTENLTQPPVVSPNYFPGTTGQGFDALPVILALAPLFIFLIILYWGSKKRHRKQVVIGASYYLIILDLLFVAFLPLCNQLLSCLGWSMIPLMMFALLMIFASYRKKKELEHKSLVAKAVAEGHVKYMPQAQTLHGPGFASVNREKPKNILGLILYYFNTPIVHLNNFVDMQEKKPREEKPKTRDVFEPKKSTETWRTRLERMGKSSESQPILVTGGATGWQTESKTEQKSEQKIEENVEKRSEEKIESKKWFRSPPAELEDKDRIEKQKGGFQKKLFEALGSSKRAKQDRVKQYKQLSEDIKSTEKSSKPNYVERKIAETLGRQHSIAFSKSPAKDKIGTTKKVVKLSSTAQGGDLVWEEKFNRWKNKKARLDATEKRTELWSPKEEKKISESEKNQEQTTPDEHTKIENLIQSVLSRRRPGKPKEEGSQ